MLLKNPFSFIITAKIEGAYRIKPSKDNAPKMAFQRNNECFNSNDCLFFIQVCKLNIIVMYTAPTRYVRYQRSMMSCIQDGTSIFSKFKAKGGGSTKSQPGFAGEMYNV